MENAAPQVVNKLLETGEAPFSDPSAEVLWLTGRPASSQRELIRGLLLGKRRESQYVSAYLDHNGALGWGNGITPGTFLNRMLRGRRKNYYGSYYKGLMNGLEQRVKLGMAVVGDSANYPGATDRPQPKAWHTAYYPVSQEALERLTQP